MPTEVLRPLGNGLAARLRVPAVALSLALGAAGLAAQAVPIAVPPAPPGFSYSGGIHEWLEREPSLSLADSSGEVRLWLATWHGGLLVAGAVEGGLAHFEATGETLRRGDHVELALATVSDLELPPVGWGNQFGETLLGDGGCEELYARADPDGARAQIRHCNSWLEGQRRHRGRLRQLYLRRWLLAPHQDYRGLAVENVATQAFSGLELAARERLALLRPSSRPQIHGNRWPAREQRGGYYFEVVVPWEAMPPANALLVERLFLQIEVHRATVQERPTRAIDLPGSSPQGAWRELVLERPKGHRLGACRAPLDGWFLLQSDLQVASSFELVNEAGGYWYEPRGLSPGLEATQHFLLPSPSGMTICGPQLALLRERARIEARISSRGGQPLVVPRESQAKKIGDRLLVMVGPRTYYSRFGSGQCGACPRYGVQVYQVFESGRTSELFAVYGVLDQGRIGDADIHVSDDWRRITVYQATGELTGSTSWSSTTYCLTDTVYQECGSASPDDPPEERRIRPAEAYGEH